MKKYLFGITAMSCALIALSYKKNPKKTNGTFYYFFYGTSDQSLNQISKWAPGETQLPDECENTDEVVCFIQTDKNQAAFNTYINSQSSGLTRTQLDSQPNTIIVSTRD